MINVSLSILKVVVTSSCASGKGASPGKESALADLRWAGETTAWGGWVRCGSFTACVSLFYGPAQDPKEAVILRHRADGNANRRLADARDR